MDSELNDYLGAITTPENQNTLMRTVALLDELGVVSHHDDLARILHTVESQDSYQNLQDLFSLLTLYGENAIRAFGVELANDFTLPVVNEILQGFINLPNYGDPEHLLTILDGYELVGPEETLCDLLEVVTPLMWYDMAPYVEHVSDALVDRLKDTLTNALAPEEERLDISSQRDRFMVFGAQRQNLLAWQWLRSQGAFNTALETLLNRYEEELISSASVPQTLTEELLGLVLISDTDVVAYRETISALLEDFIDDPLHVTRAYNHLLARIKEMNLEKA